MTAPNGRTLEVIPDELGDLSGIDRAFAERVYGGDLSRYHHRLEQIGFDRLDEVLDAGCGLGQWSLALAATARRVVALDMDPKGLQVLRRLARHNKAANVAVARGSTERLPLADASVDGVFSYSVVYFTDWRQSLAEYRRVLRIGGRLYLNTNAIGWFVYLLATGHNASPGYAPRRYALRSIRNTITGRTHGLSLQEGSQVTPVRSVLRTLDELGFRIVAQGDEGTIDTTGRHQTRPFFKGRRFGLPATFEVLAERVS